MKKPFGGESPVNSEGLSYAMVHSGRAALRLLFASGLNKKKILLPDYLCTVVIDVVRQCKVPHDFYHIKPDLTPDWNQMNDKRFDVLYVINYFGQKTKIPSTLLKGKAVIVDDVFAPLLGPPKGQLWATFNSLRKVTPLAEGAFVAANFPLMLDTINKKPAAFAALKYKAKQLKADYLTRQKGSQEGYVLLLTNAEAKLDSQKSIHMPSALTLSLLPQLYVNLEKEQRIRRRQYQILDKLLRQYSIGLRPDYLSFYVLKVKERDALKACLAKQGIFLAAHWPAVGILNNPLYQQILSIPLDSRYRDTQISLVAQAVRRFLK